MSIPLASLIWRELLGAPGLPPRRQKVPQRPTGPVCTLASRQARRLDMGWAPRLRCSTDVLIIVAITDCVVYTLSKHGFLSLVRRNPAIAGNMLRELVLRVEHANSQLASLAFIEVYRRLTAALAERITRAPPRAEGSASTTSRRPPSSPPWSGPRRRSPGRRWPGSRRTGSSSVRTASCGCGRRSPRRRHDRGLRSAAPVGQILRLMATSASQLRRRATQADDRSVPCRRPGNNPRRGAVMVSSTELVVLPQGSCVFRECPLLS